MLTNLLALLLFYLPFQIAINPTNGVDLASIRIFIIVLFFIFLARNLLHKNFEIPIDTPSLFLYSFLFATFFSIIFTDHIDWSLRKLAFLFSIFPVYLIAHNSWKDSKAKFLLLKSLVLGTVFSIILGFIQFSLQFIFGIDHALQLWSRIILPFLGHSFGQSVLEYPSWLVNIGGSTYFRLISVFPDPHMYAFYLGMVAPIAFALYCKTKNWLYIAAVLLILFADLLTFSRGGYLALFAVSILCFLYFLKKSKNKHVLRLLGAISLIVIISFSSPITERFISIFDSKDGSNQGRIEIWKSTGNVIYNNIFGVGIGNLPSKINPLAEYRQPIYAHNAYMDIAAETGLFGLLFWVGFLASLMITFYKRIEKDIIYAGALVSILIFAIHSLVETPIFSVHVFSLLLIIASLSYEIN